MVLDLLAKAIRQPSEPTHAHAHGQVLTLNKARRNVFWIGVAECWCLDSATAFSRAVLPFWTGCIGFAVQFHQHGVIHVRTECEINGVQVIDLREHGARARVDFARRQLAEAESDMAGYAACGDALRTFALTPGIDLEQSAEAILFADNMARADARLLKAATEQLRAAVAELARLDSSTNQAKSHLG